MAVEVVDGIENRVDDKNSVVLCNLALARTRSKSSPPVASSKER